MNSKKPDVSSSGVHDRQQGLKSNRPCSMLKQWAMDSDQLAVKVEAKWYRGQGVSRSKDGHKHSMLVRW